MKNIHKDELYDNLSDFLKGKGVELKEGPYTKGIHAGCSMLADAINLSQVGLKRAKTGLERGMDQVRQAIHEKTAPKQPPVAPKSPPKKKPSAPRAPGAKGGSKNTRRPRK